MESLVRGTVRSSVWLKQGVDVGRSMGTAGNESEEEEDWGQIRENLNNTEK